MSENDPTGYEDSPDTSDGPVAEGQQAGGAEGGATLTTDDDAQQNDGVVRPGNNPG